MTRAFLLSRNSSASAARVELDGVFLRLGKEQNEKLQVLGIRATLSRALVLRAIQDCPKRHLSAVDIYKILVDQKLDVIGLATIYRILSQFESAGILIRSAFGSKRAVYELNDRPRSQLVCVDCGAVHEFDSKALEDLQREISASEGYELAEQQLAIYGCCSDCRNSRGGRGGAERPAALAR